MSHPVVLAHEGSNSMNQAVIIANRTHGQDLLVAINGGPPPVIQQAPEKVLSALMKVLRRSKTLGRSQ